MRASSFPLTLASHTCPLCGCYKSYSQLVCRQHDPYIVYDAIARHSIEAHEAQLRRNTETPGMSVCEPSNVIQFPIAKRFGRSYA